MKAQLVIIRTVANAHVLHFVIDALDWRHGRIQRHHADPDFLFAVHLARDVSESFFYGYFNIKCGVFGGQRSDWRVFISDLHLRWRAEIPGSNGLLPFYGKRHLLRLVGVHFYAYLFEI